MKTLRLSSLIGSLLISSVISFAQNSNLVFYCNEGERFYVILNGIRQNPDPETNVKITGCNQPYYKVKLIFENPNLVPLEKNLSFNPATETVFAIKKNNKDEWVIRWQSETPIAQLPPPPADQHVIVYTTTPPPAATTTVTTTTTTVTGTGVVTPPPGGVSIGINANDQGMGVNLNVGTTQGVQSQETTTITHSTTTTTGGGVIHATPVEEVYILPGYNGPVGCPRPMKESDFSGAKQSISSKSFEDSKLQIAKQVTSANCLLSSQVKEIMLLFSFENTRLDYAKYAYSYTYDKGNFFKVNDAFTFESSIDELNDYIQSAQR